MFNIKKFILPGIVIAILYFLGRKKETVAVTEIPTAEIPLIPVTAGQIIEEIRDIEPTRYYDGVPVWCSPRGVCFSSQAGLINYATLSAIEQGQFNPYEVYSPEESHRLIESFTEHGSMERMVAAALSGIPSGADVRPHEGSGYTEHIDPKTGAIVGQVAYYY